MSEFSDLLGKKIRRIFTSEDRNIMVFETSFGAYAYFVTGECCMRAALESINGYDCLINNEILEARAADNHQFNWSIKTIQGYCDIEFRETTDTYGGYNIQIDRIEFILPFLSNDGKNSKLMYKFNKHDSEKISECDLCLYENK